ncbi:MAG: TetR/AcrR family transcriptional regulator [Oscillibacter sp.]|nr:TetR/AcrR family transcriptional regulator [Oscillibacter sp.]
MRVSKTDIKEAVCDSLCILAGNKPKEKVTIAALIDTAGICRSSFYYYFEGVDDVFTYMVDEFCEEYQKAGFLVLNQKAHGSRTGLLKAEKALCDTVLKHWERVVFFLKESNYFHFREIFYRHFQARCRSMRVVTIFPNGNRDELRGMTAYEYSVYTCCMQMLSVLELWAKRGFKEAAEDFVSIYERTFMTVLAFEAQ